MKSIIAILTSVLATIATSVTYSQSASYQKIIDSFRSTKNFDGALLVAKGGKTEFLYATGIANRISGSLITTKTKFRLCSITKTFTVALVMKLIEEGKLSLNGTIGQYLSNYKGEAKDKVNLHHLITYSSGIPNCDGGKGLEVYQTSISVDSFISKYCSGNLEFTPGTKFSYDNGGYIILGRIIEKVTGKSYAQNLQNYILTPLGMQSTGLLDNSLISEGFATPYLYSDSLGKFTNDSTFKIENFYSSGAMYSTVEDLFKFNQGLFTYKLLSKSTIDLMLISYPKLWSVAYGFWVTDNKYGNTKAKAADRRGSILGSNTTWLHLIDQDITVIIFSNTNKSPINEMREELATAALGQNL